MLAFCICCCCVGRWAIFRRRQHRCTVLHPADSLHPSLPSNHLEHAPPPPSLLTWKTSTHAPNADTATKAMLVATLGSFRSIHRLPCGPNSDRSTAMTNPCVSTNAILARLRCHCGARRGLAGERFPRPSPSLLSACGQERGAGDREGSRGGGCRFGSISSFSINCAAEYNTLRTFASPHASGRAAPLSTSRTGIFLLNDNYVCPIDLPLFPWITRSTMPSSSVLPTEEVAQTRTFARLCPLAEGEQDDVDDRRQRVEYEVLRDAEDDDDDEPDEVLCRSSCRCAADSC